MKINGVEIDNIEMEKLIDLIGGNDMKKWFKYNPKEFGKIKKGFRPDAVTEEMAIQLAKKNKESHFIVLYVEKKVQQWLDEIDEYKSNLINKGATDRGALFFTLQKSVFADDLDLYFLLDGSKFSEDFIVELKAAVSAYGIPFDLLADENNKTSNLNTSVERELIDTEESLYEARDKIQSLEEVLEKKREEYENLAQKLEELEIDNQKLSGRLSEIEDLKTYEDREYVFKSEDYPNVSVCQVIMDYNGQHWLSRVADIQDDFTLLRFKKDENKLPFFDNRDRLFLRDGIEDEGAVGVWKWNAIPNKSNPDSDYVTTAFCNEIALTEFVVIPDVGSLKELGDSLIEGIPHSTPFTKILFVYRSDNGNYEGLLCRERDWTSVNGLLKVKRDVVSLPHYRVREEDVLRIGAIEIISHIGMGTPESMFKIVDPYSVVKDILLSRLTINKLRSRGLSRKDAQNYQQFLKDIVSQDIYEEMSVRYSCSNKESEYYVQRFIEVADQYLNEDDIDLEIFSQAIHKLPDIIEIAKQVLYDEWIAENTEKIEAGNKTLSELAQSLEEKKQELLRADEQIAHLSEEIKEKKELAVSVENEVASRIKDAQQSMAQIIVDASLLAPIFNRQEITDDNELENSGKKVFTLPIAAECSGEKIDDLSSFNDELADNLRQIGYSTDGAIDMALSTSFCLAEKIPLVCCGNSINIALCIAATLGEREISVIDIPLSDYMKEIEVLAKEDELRKVVLIQGVFDSYSANAFNTIIARLHAIKKEILFVLSMDGVDTSDVPPTVWNNAFFVNGDIDLKKIACENIHSFECEVVFGRDYKDNKKLIELKPFASIVDNIAVIRYASFLSYADCEVGECVPVLRQLEIRANTIEKKDALKDAMSEIELAHGIQDRLKLWN